jgi:hypothetical protein
MLRSGFFAGGMFVLIWGASFLMIDRVIFKMEEVAVEKKGASLRGLFTTLNAENKRELSIPDWGCFSMMSIGAVTMLYAVALPKK